MKFMVVGWMRTEAWPIGTSQWNPSIVSFFSSSRQTPQPHLLVTECYPTRPLVWAKYLIPFIKKGPNAKTKFPWAQLILAKFVSLVSNLNVVKREGEGVSL
uniref:Uncharacterized protein n=1 Tax=Opuntia streptacantha TaxID=393608 RepID=A0A7C8YY65_OPUST